MPYSGVDLNNTETFDLWRTTLSAFDWENRDMEYLFPLHQFIVCDEWFKRDRVEIDGGTKIERNVIYRENGSTAFVLPGQVRERSSRDVVVRIDVPYCGTVVEHSITATEVRRNAGRAKLKDEARKKRAAAMMDIAKTIEERSWFIPDASSNVYPYGVPYWIIPITGAQVTSATYGHQGYYNTAFSDCAGIASSATAYSRWANYNDVWSNSNGQITEDDFQKLSRMFRHLHFRAPMIADEVNQPKLTKYRMYTDETIIDAYAKAVRKNRDDLTADGGYLYGAGLNAMTGGPTLKGFPIIWVEELDTADTTNRGANPFYMLNHDYFYPVVEQGMYFSEDVPQRTVEQPDVFTTWVDLMWQLLCHNRQLGGGNISYVAAA
jgi:hypothetical protein